MALTFSNANISMNHSFHPAFAAFPSCTTRCHISIAIPVCNEEARLWATLQALADQRQLNGRSMDREYFEVVLLLNRCSDHSARVAQRFLEAHPGFCLRIAEWNFEDKQAHVGSARSLLLQQCALRLELQPRHSELPRLLLTTDADTIVDRQWIAETVRSVCAGADAVGGNILMRADERCSLQRRARKAYALDRRYRRAAALLESLLDPQVHDPWPRHQHHFGGSMACTLEAYRRSGGMQPLPVLEDLAFYHALIESGARFRHEPRVRVYTSARTDGRVAIGLSEQLKKWERRRKLLAPSTALLVAIFKGRALLREAMMRGPQDNVAVWQCAAHLRLPIAVVERVLNQDGSLDLHWKRLGADAHLRAFLTVDAQHGPMAVELRNLQQLTSQLRRSAVTHPCDTSRVGALQATATMAG